MALLLRKVLKRLYFLNKNPYVRPKPVNSGCNLFKMFFLIHLFRWHSPWSQLLNLSIPFHIFYSPSVSTKCISYNKLTTVIVETIHPTYITHHNSPNSQQVRTWIVGIWIPDISWFQKVSSCGTVQLFNGSNKMAPKKLV